MKRAAVQAYAEQGGSIGNGCRNRGVGPEQTSRFPSIDNESCKQMRGPRVDGIVPPFTSRYP
jgi:hypothetical protein